MTAADKKSVVSEVGSWIWGTIEGGFNEQQSISQIIVDAAIGMIPVVGDITAVRDLIAIILQLIQDPEKRKSKLAWILLVVLLLALLPVAGGILKGVGKLILDAGEDVARHGELVQKIVDLLNHVGKGNAVKFLKELDFEKYTGDIVSAWRKLAQQLDNAITSVLGHVRVVIPDAMIARLKSIQAGLRDLKDLAEQMIPDAIKDLNSRLKAIQQHLYDGTWHEIPAAATASKTREAEARLLEKETDAKKLAAPEVPPVAFPKNAITDFHPVEGWPNLSLPPWTKPDGTNIFIASFSGPIEAITLQEGTKIRRVVTETSNTAGLNWMLAEEFAQDGKAWREQWAVLDSFSTNGFYVEFTVPPGGLNVWVGKASTQIGNTAGGVQQLSGGATQIFIDFTFGVNLQAQEAAKALPRIPTGWTFDVPIGVTPMSVDVESLSPDEVEPRTSSTSGDAP